MFCCQVLKFPFFFVVGLYAASGSLAQDSPINGTTPTREIIETLEVTASNVNTTIPRMEYLSVHFNGKKGDVILLPRYAVDLTIHFAYNSSTLSTNAKAQLDVLASALLSPELRNQRFLISGHTDAGGNADYNAKLSMARAQAATKYLIDVWGIKPKRLVAHGWGKANLKKPHAPFAAENRRVEVIAILDLAQTVGKPTVDVETDPVNPTARFCFRHSYDPRQPNMDLDDFGGGKRSPNCIRESIVRDVDE